MVSLPLGSGSWFAEFASPTLLLVVLLLTVTWVIYHLFEPFAVPNTDQSKESTSMFASAKDSPVPPIPEGLPTVSKQELARHDGVLVKDSLWLGVSGYIFDVSSNAEMYQAGKGYSIFVGKDASYALAKSSLKVEDAHDRLDSLSNAEVRNTLVFAPPDHQLYRLYI